MLEYVSVSPEKEMSRPRYTSYLSLIYIAGLLALLAVLAVLQYRWTGEASLAEQERMRQGLNESLGFLERSLDREISRVVLTYWHFPGWSSADATGSDWQTRLSRALIDASGRWQSSAADSPLISRVLVAESSPDLMPRLYSFEASRNQLQTTSWPDNLARFKSFLQSDAGRDFAGQRERSELYERRRAPADFIIDEVPALARPLVIDPPTGVRQERPGHGLPTPRERRVYLIVCLDRNYLFSRRIPELAKRYLSREGDSGYDYVIRSGQDPHLILSSSPGADTRSIVALPDASVRLLRLHQEELEDERRTGARIPPLSVDTGVRRRSPAPARGGGEIAIDVRDPDRLAQERSMEQRRHLQATAEILASRGWELLAKHRAGSLNAVVASTRLRNLAVSLGILLVLGVSLVMLTVSVRRAKHLSKQQMEFVAGVSHELRTPIAVICSTAENLADGVITTNEQVRRYGQYILREGWRLDTLVEQTMEFAGIGSGIRRFHIQTLDLNQLVSDAVDAFRIQISEKQLKIEVSTTTGVFAKGDAAAVSCAIGNLVSNAVKYSRPGGQIGIAVENGPRADTVVVKVSDQGIGIEAGEVRRIFEPFFRGSNAARAQIRGAGIGLSLVKRIVEAHHGTVSVKSKVEQGSVFTVVLPSARAEATLEREGATGES